jgi:hypothetical protein
MYHHHYRIIPNISAKYFYPKSQLLPRHEFLRNISTFPSCTLIGKNVPLFTLRLGSLPAVSSSSRRNSCATSPSPFSLKLSQNQDKPWTPPMNSPVIGLCANCNTGYRTFCSSFFFEDVEDDDLLLRRREEEPSSSSPSSPNPIALFTDDAARLSQPMVVVVLSTRRRLFKTFSLSLFVRVSFDVALARPRNRSIDCVVFKRERER